MDPKNWLWVLVPLEAKQPFVFLESKYCVSTHTRQPGKSKTVAPYKESYPSVVVAQQSKLVVRATQNEERSVHGIRSGVRPAPWQDTGQSRWGTPGLSRAE